MNSERISCSEVKAVIIGAEVTKSVMEYIDCWRVLLTLSHSRRTDRRKAHLFELEFEVQEINQRKTWEKGSETLKTSNA